MHRYVAPRAYQYHLLPDRSNQRTEFLTTVVGDIFERFDDMHPNTIGFATPEAALSYEKDVRQYVSQRASAIGLNANTLTNPARAAAAPSSSKVEDAIYDCFARRHPVRAHDLWAKQELVTADLEKEFKTIEANAVKNKGEKWAADNRMHLMQLHRKKRFEMEDYAVQKKWKKDAKKPEHNKLEPKDIPTFAMDTLPVVNAVASWFSEKTGCPMFVAAALPSVANPGLIDVFT